MSHYNDLSYLGSEAPNVNHETGIRYGYISSNRVNSDAVNDIQQNGEDLTYQAAVDEAKNRVADALADALAEMGLLHKRYDVDTWDERSADRLTAAADAAWETVSDAFNDRYEADGSTYEYEADGYKLILMSDGDICVLESPFFTVASLGSPCIPNGVYLGKDNDGGEKAYCLGADWFDEYDPLPYTVYSVETGEVVARPTTDTE